MAVQWTGNADAITQISTITITGFDASTVYKVTIGQFTVQVTGITSANATASALKNALAASTHPYFKYITWTVATNVVTGTAQVGGLPHTISVSVTGVGTIAGATPTVATGPNFWDNAANWDGGVIPANTDDVIFADNSVPVLFGINQSGVTLNSLRIYQSYTGRIGLDSSRLTISANGGSYDETVNEYRANIYLLINVTNVYIGENLTSVLPAGAGRIMLDVGTATASTIEVFNSASSGFDKNKPAIRIKANNAATKLYVRSAPTGVGIAIDKASETTTIGTVTISDTSSTSKVFIGKGTTITTYTQEGGDNLLQAAATVTTVIINGGTLQTEGNFTITTCTQNGGTFYQNHIKTAANCITTFNLNKGVCITLENNIVRTYGTLALRKDVSLDFNPNVVSWTTLTWLANAASKLSVA